MTIVGVNIEAIEAKRSDFIGGALRVRNVPSIRSLEVKKIDSIGKEALVVNFDFVSDYEQDNEKKKRSDQVARIKFTGNVVFLAPDGKAAVADWKKGKLSGEIVIPVFNAILRKCVAKAIDISTELQLPPPIQFPLAKEEVKGDAARYIG